MRQSAQLTPSAASVAASLSARCDLRTASALAMRCRGRNPQGQLLNLWEMTSISVAPISRRSGARQALLMHVGREQGGCMPSNQMRWPWQQAYSAKPNERTAAPAGLPHLECQGKLGICFQCVLAVGAELQGSRSEARTACVFPRVARVQHERHGSSAQCALWRQPQQACPSKQAPQPASPNLRHAPDLARLQDSQLRDVVVCRQGSEG